MSWLFAGGWRGPPVAEKLLRVFLSLLEREIPSQNQRRVFRRVIPLVELHKIVALDRLDRFHRAAGGVSVLTRSVNNPIGDKSRQGAGLLQRHPQTIESLILEPVDLFLFESWMQDHVRENAQRRLCVAGHHDNERARRIPTRARIDLAAERFNRACDLRRRHFLGAFG